MSRILQKRFESGIVIVEVPVGGAVTARHLRRLTARAARRCRSSLERPFIRFWPPRRPQAIKKARDREPGGLFITFILIQGG